MKKKQYVSPHVQIVTLGKERLMFTVSPGVSGSEWTEDDGFGAKQNDMDVDDFYEFEETTSSEKSLQDFIPKKFNDAWKGL